MNLKALFTLEGGSKKKAALMFLYNFILLNTLYLLKPVRDSLFLEQAGSHNLPSVFILTALVVIPVSIGYSNIAKRHSIGWTINIVTIFLAINLYLIWRYIHVDNTILYYAFYIWVSIYGVLITSQFWLFANIIFNSTESKKVFGALSLGAVLGGFTGGELTSILVNHFSLQPQNLLLISAVIITATIPLVWMILKLKKPGVPAVHESDPDDKTVSANPIKEIFSHNHLMLIIALITITVMVTTLVDYQFKTIAERAFTDKVALTSFLGKFYGRVSLIALLIQICIGTIFTKKYGLTPTLLLLPAALLISAGGMLIVPGLVAGTLSRGIDQSLKHSVDRTGKELLFVPLSDNLKKRVKVFIDLFVDNGAQGITGLLLLGLTFGMNLNVQEISVVVICLLAAWIVIAKMAGNSYVDVFRNTLKQEVENNSEKSYQNKTNPQDTGSETVHELLQSEQESDLLWALELLKKNKRISVDADLLVRHIRHPSCRVKTKLLQVLHEKKMGILVDKVIDLAYDEDPDVRMEAIRYVYEFHEGDRKEKLRIGLHHEDVRIRAVATGLIAEDVNKDERSLITDKLLEEALGFDGESGRELRRQTAKVLSVAYNPDRARFIKRLLRDENPSVVKEAIKSAGKIQDREFVHDLLLRMDNSIYRKTAENALVEFGSRIYGTMHDYMTDSHLPVSTRRFIPWLFSQTMTEDAWNILKMSLKIRSVPIRHGVIKALLRMRKKRSAFQLSDEIIAHNTEREIERYSKLKKAFSFYRSGKIHLSAEAEERLEYEIDQTFENIFRLLSLNNNIGDIRNAYKAIVGTNPQLRSDAIEFTENLITWDVRKLLIPVLETYHTDRLPPNDSANALSNAEDVLLFLKEIFHTESEGISVPNPVEINQPAQLPQIIEHATVEVG